jgi:hypothetical protein
MAKQKQIQTNFRTTPEMKARLEAAAESNGLTFNKEVNRRLAESFDPRRELDPVLSDPVLFGMIIVLAKAMQKTGMPVLLFTEGGHTKNERDWHRDPYAYARAVEAAIEVLNLFRPEGEETAPDLGADHEKLRDAITEMGRMNGRGEMRNLGRRAPEYQTVPKDDLLREMLGEEMLQRIRNNLGRLK